MIDLSHLTEEEQEAIMTVIRRDSELKKAEEERVRKLAQVQEDAKLKYLTGEWFYEAKSRRHADKIHGSDIILASMKQGKAAGLDGSLKVDRPKALSSRGSDAAPPAKPPRYSEALASHQTNDAEKENQYSAVCSPRVPRHNPFNRASLIVVECPENHCDLSNAREQEPQQTDLLPPLKSRPVAGGSQTSGASIPSENSSVGFRPVPKKRTFLSRRPITQSESNGQLETQAEPAPIVPAPRRRVQRGRSESSDPACRPAEENLPPPSPTDIPQNISSSSLKREASSPGVLTEKPDGAMERRNVQRSEELTDLTQTCGVVNLSINKTPGRAYAGTAEREDDHTAVRQDDRSLSHSPKEADLLMSYDLHFIDKSEKQVQTTGQKHALKLSPLPASPTGEEEDSIAKVLDWFNRSTDSLDWLNGEDKPRLYKNSDRHLPVSKFKDQESREVSERKKETLETKRSVPLRQSSQEKDFKATFRRGKEDVVEIQEGLRTRSRERPTSSEGRDESDEGQSLKLSHLKSFWEKSNTGPKILISNSLTPGERGVKGAHLPTEKDSDPPSGPGTHGGKRSQEKSTSNKSEDKQQVLETNTGFRLHQDTQEEISTFSPTPRNNMECDYLKLRTSVQMTGRGGSDMDAFCVSRLCPVEKTADLECEIVPVIKPRLQTDAPPKLNDPTQRSVAEDSTYNSYADYKHFSSDLQIATKVQPPRCPSEDGLKRDSEMPLKRKEPAVSKERSGGPLLIRAAVPHQESTAEKIKQLKSFWEQERNKPAFHPCRVRVAGDGKTLRGAGQAKLNKRFTKSEFDLRSVGYGLGSDEEDDSRGDGGFPALAFQRLDRLSPSLSASRMQFNNLREFWGEPASDSRGSLTSEKPKSPKRKDALSTQLSSQELKNCDSEVCYFNPTVEKSKATVGIKSTLSGPSRATTQVVPASRGLSDSKTNLPGYMPAEPGQHRLSKRSSKESSREEKAGKSQSGAGKEIRQPKSRKDGFAGPSSRGSSMRRATSMFSLSATDEKDSSPIHSQSRRHRLSNEKGSLSRKLSEEPETVAPRARAFVPRDYRHYLGMTDESSVHTLLAPTPKDEVMDHTTNHSMDMSGPGKTSTPISSEERHGRKVSKLSQRQVWANHSESDTGQESSVSSVTESWTNSRTASGRENDSEENPIRKALRRAEARPKNLAKSMGDITASPRQEKRQDPVIDTRRSSDASAITPPSSSLFSDPGHLKKMSKSVPSFLQKEDSQSHEEDAYHSGRLMAGSSEINLRSSLSMKSLSGSVMTMYSGDFVEVQGNIHFSINYVQRLREFHIFVSECRDLAAVDPKRGRSDPYVKSYLVPDKANLGKRKTSVKKKTLNPTFNEILRYRVRMEYLRTQTLILSVWHHDTFGRNSFLGEVDVDLSKWDFDHTQMNYLALKARTLPAVEPTNGRGEMRGEMRLAIRFLPQISHSEGVTKVNPNSGEIHIWVKDCKSLPLIRATIDPYVKCFVLPDTSRKSRQKTRVLRRTVDPVFNHTMVYDGISDADLMEACVELTVWDRDRLASNLLGGLRLGVGTGRSYGALVDWMDSGPYEVALWERMIASPSEWVEGVLPLRMLNSAKTAFK